MCLPSGTLIVSILSICMARICFWISAGILSHCSNRSLYVPTQCQICVTKLVFCIPLYLSTSKVTWRKLLPAQLSKECFTAVAASNKHSGVTSVSNGYGLPGFGPGWNRTKGPVPGQEPPSNMNLFGLLGLLPGPDINLRFLGPVEPGPGFHFTVPATLAPMKYRGSDRIVT